MEEAREGSSESTRDSKRVRSTPMSTLVGRGSSNSGEDGDGRVVLTGQAASGGGAEDERHRPLGIKALSLVVKVMGCRRETWGLSRGADLVTPRRVVLHSLVPVPVTLRLVDMLRRQKEAEERKVAPPPPTGPRIKMSAHLRKLLLQEGSTCMTSGDESLCASEKEEADGPRSFAVAQVRLGQKFNDMGFLWSTMKSSTKSSEHNVAGFEEHGGMVQRLLQLLPRSITHVIFGDLPNERVTRLPEWLTVVEFGQCFAHCVSLPSGLRKVVFGDMFNCHDVLLPPGLEEVTFGRYFTGFSPRPLKQQQQQPQPQPQQGGLQSGRRTTRAQLSAAQTVVESVSPPLTPLPAVHPVLPSTLRKITFGNRFNQQVDLPNLLDAVEFGDWFDRAVVLPAGGRFRSVKFGCSYNQDTKLPDSLEEVIFGRDFNRPVVLPASLRKVVFGDAFNQPGLELPHQQLAEVAFGQTFNRPLCLPSCLKKVSFGDRFQQLDPHLPESLEELSLAGSCFNAPLPALPPSLKSLRLGNAYNQSHLTLPKGLEKISFGRMYSLQTDHVVERLPLSIRELTFSLKFWGEGPPFILLEMPVEGSVPAFLSTAVAQLHRSGVHEVRRTTTYRFGTMTLFFDRVMPGRGQDGIDQAAAPCARGRSCAGGDAGCLPFASPEDVGGRELGRTWSQTEAMSETGAENEEAPCGERGEGDETPQRLDFEDLATSL